MGCYDTVLVRCPQCGEESGFQSKSGECLLRVFKLADCPPDVMFDVNRHAPNKCEKCGTWFQVEFHIDPAVIVKPETVRDAKSVAVSGPGTDPTEADERDAKK